MRFMYGRNGMDQLNRALFWVYLALWLAGSLLAVLELEVLSAIFNVVLYVLLVVILFRMLSKNLYKRREENSKFLQKTWSLRNQIGGAKARHADKDHKYFTCKQCKTICRVPVGKGKIIITCPKCRAQIQAKT
ncbi:MAG: hypothetical protein IJ396_00220 [Oscillibacter sp.]|nr:hypothetical protein [Oscillibacter sp.]